MHKVLVGLTLFLVNLPLPARAGLFPGLVKIESNHSVEDTVQRFESILNEKGLTIFATVDHAAGASSVGQELRPTQLVIFGNPKVGTPLMQCSQGVAIDLPQKALVWQDEVDRVWIGYNDPAYLDFRHNLEGCEAPLEKVKQALGTLTQAAAQP
ncbi:MAG: DUF302 domain-containing protein [Cyanobacteria bacterium J06641_5]